MKLKNLCILLSLAAALSGHAQTPAAPTSADAEYAAFITLMEAPPPPDFATLGTEQKIRIVDGLRQKYSALALAFYEAHPTDPRRWELIYRGADQAPLFVKSYGPNFATKSFADAVIDEVAKAAWQAKMDVIKAALLAASDVPPRILEHYEWEKFAKDFRATSQAKTAGQPYDYEPFKARFAAHLAKFTGEAMLPERAADYLGALEQSIPGEGLAGWKALADSPDTALRERARRELGAVERLSKPFELAFTAVDGRAVDVTKLRGKVVLVDFWATWCGPCKAELPNVKKVYAAYHDRGFEVVGISLENASLAPKDTTEQTAAKLEKARKGLTDFTTANAMPWPQYFDGKFWQNEISNQYAITGIPAMFLLDQDGKVVSTNARGELLEKEVKRLLKL